jgi:hypothetical protein
MRCRSCGSAVSPLLYRCGQCDAVLPPPPGAIATRATPDDPPVPPVRLTDGLGQTVIACIWLAALVEAAAVMTLAREIQLRAPDPVVRLSPVDAALLTTGLALEAATALLLVAWLFRARANLDAFVDTAPEWGRWAAVWSWLVPVANLVIVPAVIADVARASADDPSGAEGRAQARRVWTWWVVCLGRPLLTWVGIAVVAPLLADALWWFESSVAVLLVGAAPGVVVTVGTAVLAGRVVGGICREQRERAQRLEVQPVPG